MPDFDIQTGVLIWIAMLGVILIFQRTQKLKSVGLVLAYFLTLALIHLTGAALYLVPEYAYNNRTWVLLGFEQSAYAIMAFGTGVAATLWLLRHASIQTAEPDEELVTPPVTVTPWLHRFYVALGLLNYFVILPLLTNIPTVGAVASVLSLFLLLGICLGMRQSWLVRNWALLGGWLLMLGALPILTILAQGFLGYGTAELMTGLTFLATFFRPRWVIPLAGIVFVLVGISVFVTYSRDRTEIRRVVWGEESFQDRVDQLVETFSDFEWFDPANSRHLNTVDVRLNQNVFVGAAVQRIQSNTMDFRNGETITDAFIAFIPRAIWQDKPTRAGSGNLVTDATGIPFARGTSVGVGQVLEFYYNFGTPGVVVGGLFWGIALALLDTAAGRALIQGNIRRFSIFYLVGLAFLQPGGSLVDVTSTIGAAVVAALLVNDFLVPYFVGAFQDDSESTQPTTLTPGAS